MWLQKLVTELRIKYDYENFLLVYNNIYYLKVLVKEIYAWPHKIKNRGLQNLKVAT